MMKNYTYDDVSILAKKNDRGTADHQENIVCIV